MISFGSQTSVTHNKRFVHWTYILLVKLTTLLSELFHAKMSLVTSSLTSPTSKVHRSASYLPNDRAGHNFLLLSVTKNIM